MKVADLYIALALLAVVGGTGWYLCDKYSKDKAEVRELRHDLDRMSARQFEALSHGIRSALTEAMSNNAVASGGIASGIESATVAATS